MGIGRRIKEARENLGLTQNELGELIGVTGSAITNYEKETSHPKEPIMYKLIDVLHVDANYLFQDVVNIPKQANDVTFAEYEYIKKYRFVSHYDETGKTILDSLLNCLYDKIKQSQEKDARITELEITTLPTRIISYYQKLASAGSGEYLFDEIPCDNIVVPENSLSEKADFVIGVNGHSMDPTYRDGDKVYVEISEEIPTGSIGIFTRGNECFIKELGTDRLISHNPDKDMYPDIPATTDIRCVGLVLGKVEEL